MSLRGGVCEAAPATPAGLVLSIHGLTMTGACWAGWELVADRVLA